MHTYVALHAMCPCMHMCPCMQCGHACICGPELGLCVHLTPPTHTCQDVSGGVPVKVVSPFGGLWAMEIDPEQARQELRSIMQVG